MALDPGGAAVLMLLNPTGGLVGGDVLRTEVTVGEGAHCCLTTPSATKVYRTAGPAAVQEFSARLGPGAVLEYVPDHLIPSPGAIFRQSIQVEMGEGSVAMLFDGCAVGRVMRGEAWRFTELDNALTVTDSLGLRLRDRFRLVPARRAWAGLGGTEGMDYFGTVALLFDGDAGTLPSELATMLAALPGIRGGVAPLGHGGLLVRFLAASAPEFQATFRELWGIGRRALLRLGELDLRKT